MNDTLITNIKKNINNHPELKFLKTKVKGNEWHRINRKIVYEETNELEAGIRIYAEKDNDKLVEWVQKTGKEAYLRRNDGKGYLKYSLKNEKETILSLIPDARLVNLLQYFAWNGYDSISLYPISHDEYITLSDKWKDCISKCGLRILEKCGDAKINVADFYRSWEMLSSISFEDLYINSIKCLAKNFNDIAIVEDGRLSERIMGDLRSIGKDFAIIHKKHINKFSGKIVVDRKYEIVVSTAFYSMCYSAETQSHTPIFHQPFLGFLSISQPETLGYYYEKDIAYNIIPRIKQIGAKIVIVENPRFANSDIDSRFTKSPSVMVGDFYNKECVEEFWEGVNKEEARDHWLVSLRDGCVYFCDYVGRFFTRVRGERMTPGSKYDDSQNVYMLGACIMEGVTASDERTIQAGLQKITDKVHFHNVCVPVNWENIRLRQLHIKQNDLIVLLCDDNNLFEEIDVDKISIADCYYKDYENRKKFRWDTPLHVNGSMNELIALELHEKLKSYYAEPINSSDTRIAAPTDIYQYEYLWYKYHDGLKKWIADNKQFVKSEGKNGAIVMNCNPFTKGHQYLIETARKLVDTLYIFVVEEDKSVFPFEERLRMVKAGTKDMENVIVLPSGRFMISADTLPEYFVKENIQEEIVDASYDVILFAEAIAPLFRLSVRFAGEEPEDRVTAQYNGWMASILPEYGIEFKVFPRKEKEGKPISGTYVRKLYSAERWEEMCDYVPAEVINVLRTGKEKNQRG